MLALLPAYGQKCDTDHIMGDTLRTNVSWMSDGRKTFYVNDGDEMIMACRVVRQNDKNVSLEFYDKNGKTTSIPEQGHATELEFMYNRTEDEGELIAFTRECNLKVCVITEKLAEDNGYYTSSESEVAWNEHAKLVEMRYFEYNEKGDTLEWETMKIGYDKRFPCKDPIMLMRNSSNSGQELQIREYDRCGDLVLETTYDSFGRSQEKQTMTVEKDTKGRETKRQTEKISEQNVGDTIYYQRDVSSHTITTTYDDEKGTSYAEDVWKNKEEQDEYYGTIYVDTYSTKLTTPDSIIVEDYRKNENGEWILKERALYDGEGFIKHKEPHETYGNTIRDYKNNGLEADCYETDENGKIVKRFKEYADKEGVKTVTYAEVDGEWMISGEEYLTNDAKCDEYDKHPLRGTRIFSDYALVNGRYVKVGTFKHTSDKSYKLTNGDWTLYQESRWSYLFGSSLDFNAYYKIYDGDTLIVKDDEVYADKRWTTEYRYKQTSDGEKKGHEYVDLGLTSGNLWATANMGAETFYDNGDDYSQKKAAKDVARKEWGKGWTVPTAEDWIELINECQWTPLMSQWIDKEDDEQWVYGVMITGPNGKTIFMPLQYRGEARTMYMWTKETSVVSYQNYYMEGHMPKIENAWSEDLELGIRPVLKTK